MGREEVLGNVRAALTGTPATHSSVPALPPWRPPREAIEDPVDRFVREVEAVSGEVVMADDAATGIREVAERSGLSMVFAPFEVSGLAPADADVAWQRPAEVLGVARADHGIASSGTCVLDAPSSHDLWTEHAVIVLDPGRIVPDLWSLPASGEHRVMVTGPSRTADIEKKLVLGAHGPRRLTVLLVP